MSAKKPAAALKLDSHVDVSLPSTPKQYWDKDGKSFADVDKLSSGGIDAVAFAIAVGPGPRARPQAMRKHGPRQMPSSRRSSPSSRTTAAR